MDSAANETLDQPLWDGVQSLLDHYMPVDPRDDVVIVYTPDSREAAAWVYLALEDRGLTPQILSMEPLRDPGFGERLRALIPPRRHKDGRCVVMLFERDTMSHNDVVRAAFRDYAPEQYRVLRAINSGRELFTVGMAVTPAELSARNTALLERLMGARRARIRTGKGTDLEVALDSARFRWISNRGVAPSGKFLIVPPGEIATYPAAISGTLVADFAINSNTVMKHDARLERWPVTVEIEDGVLRDYRCDNPEVMQSFELWFARPNARRVGELGFGTHVGVTAAVAENSHLNERCPGVHVGFGQHNQTSDATGYYCDIHVDLVARGGLVWPDDGGAPIDLANVVPSSSRHPDLTGSEDVFSEEVEGDCCGMSS